MNRYTDKDIMYYYISRKMFLKDGIDIEKLDYWQYRIYDKTLLEYGLILE
jgi:hypothetical protein